jgi:hypothetical protein
LAIHRLRATEREGNRSKCRLPLTPATYIQRKFFSVGIGEVCAQVAFVEPLAKWVD